MIVKLLGDSNFAMRLVPLTAGITSLFLFANLAGRMLPRRAGLVALVLFAFSDDLIYYSTEMKPYSVDLVIGLAISLAAFDAMGNPASPRSAAVLLGATVLAPWCSFASAFVATGCGTTLILTHLRSARYRVSLAWVMIGIVWLANFFASYTMSRRLLSPSTTMYLFWDFAFLRVVPLNLASLSRTSGILLEIFVNPLNLVVPLWPTAGVVLPMVLLLIGGVSLARRSWPAFLLLVLPIVLAMVASAMRRFPFHGRLILELVPALFLLIAEGTEWLRRHDSSRYRLWSKMVLVLLLAYPCLTAFYHASGVRPRYYNAHGDLHGNVFVE